MCKGDDMNILLIWGTTVIAMVFIMLIILIIGGALWLTMSNDSPLPNNVAVRLISLFFMISIIITLLIYTTRWADTF
jgi:membrane-anchored protein YejM (alkaline phosphatase superfamily)